MAKIIYNSPKVGITERDLTYSIETIGLTSTVLVGETQKGPAFEPMLVKSNDEFSTIFGRTSPEKFIDTQIPKYELAYIAKAYLQQSNQLYVNRILGLSGYENGTAYVIKSLGAVDIDSLSATTNSTDIVFSGTTGATTLYVNGSTTTLKAQVATTVGISGTKFDGVFDTTFIGTGVPNLNAMRWGSLTSGVTTTVNAGIHVSKSIVDGYEYPSTLATANQEQYWLQKEFSYNTGTGLYSGVGFAVYVRPGDINITSTGITGTCKVIKITYSAQPVAEFHAKELAILRSRGAYTSDNLGFHVDYCGLSNNTAALLNPYATFKITGATTGDTNFSYTVTLDKDEKSYIKNVLGINNFDKSNYLYVEEMYDTFLEQANARSLIRGIYPALYTGTTWDHKQFQYQTPITPYFVSELRGGLPERLFRFVAISDGENANIETKISIANVDLDKKTFDVYVRNFNDQDKNTVILERYLNCVMDETSDSFVGRKIGTYDGKYDLKSSYIMIEMANKFPEDAVPAGFEGYPVRSNGTNVYVPDVYYNTRYYNAGETIYTPLIGASVTSPGDKIKKVYLGFSDTIGYDNDLLKFKGKTYSISKTWNSGGDWTGLTKGFHLDVDAQNIVDNGGNELFAYGVSGFTSASSIAANSNHPYNNIKSRKFTCLFYGGFDGWDIYRKSRTNTDTYRIGQTGFVNAGFDTYIDSEFNETLGTSDYYAYLYGYMKIQDPEEIPCDILATPGIDLVNNTSLVEEVIDIVEEERKDCIYLPTIPDINLINNADPTDTDSWLYPEDIVTELETTEIDSNYTGVYYPWILKVDTENNANIYIPPTAEVIKNLAYTDNIANPWWATAGYSRGLVNAKRTRLKINEDSRDILYEGRINPLATFSDIGVVIWGNRNLQEADSALNRLNIRRLLLNAEKLIASVGKRLLFDQNDEQVKNDFLNAVNPILDNIRKERGLTDFRVILKSSTENDDRNTLRGKIFLKPISALEFIDLEFVITPTSVSFENY